MRPTATSPSTEPWALARDAAQTDRLSQVLFDVAEAVRIAAVLLLPVMPRSAAEILRRIGETRPAGELRLDDAEWRAEGERVLVKGDALWPRIEPPGGSRMRTEPKLRGAHRWTDATRLSRPRRQPPPQRAAAPTPAAGDDAPRADERISIEDFMKVDLRVAKVLTAEKVPKSRKLVKLSDRRWRRAAHDRRRDRRGLRA